MGKKKIAVHCFGASCDPLGDASALLRECLGIQEGLFAVSNGPSEAAAAEKGRRGASPFLMVVEKLSAVEKLVDKINAGSRWNHAALMAQIE